MVKKTDAPAKYPVPAIHPEHFFAELARITIQVHMKKRDIGYRELTELYNRQFRLNENERNLRNKIARGTFSAGFLFMCMIAMDVTSIEISMDDLHGQVLFGKKEGE